VWSGHSCPLPLTLVLNSRTDNKINVKGGGQECPPHTCVFAFCIFRPYRRIFIYMPQIQIPSPLRQYSGKQSSVDVAASTVGEALAGLVAQHPDLKRHLYNEDGKLRAFVNVYVNDEDMRYLQKEATVLKDGDTISIVPSIAGGF
jgi:sulfur-carrier protein